MIVMKRLCLFFIFTLPCLFCADDIEQELKLDLFSNDYTQLQSLFSNCSKLKDPLGAYPIKQSPPVYPRRALEAGIEGITLVKIMVRKDGTVKETEVVWSSADDSRSQNLFHRSSIKAGNKFIYEPKLNKDGQKVEFTTYSTIAYSIDGNEEVLNLGNQSREFRKYRKLMKNDPQRFLEEIDIVLNENILQPMQKAIYLYFKARVLSQQGEEKEKIIQTLEESQKLYWKIHTYVTDDEDEKDIYLMGRNESKLHTFVGPLLSQLYLQKRMWNEAAIQSSTVIRNSRQNQKKPSGRLYQSYIHLGISAFNLKLWCEADESWAIAKAMAKRLKREFPDSLSKFKDEANKRRNL